MSVQKSVRAFEVGYKVDQQDSGPSGVHILARTCINVIECQGLRIALPAETMRDPFSWPNIRPNSVWAKRPMPASKQPHTMPSDSRPGSEPHLSYIACHLAPSGPNTCASRPIPGQCNAFQCLYELYENPWLKFSADKKPPKGRQETGRECGVAWMN